MKKTCFIFGLVTSVACKVLPALERHGIQIGDNEARIEDIEFILSSSGKLGSGAIDDRRIRRSWSHHLDLFWGSGDLDVSKDWTTSTTEELTTTVSDPNWTIPLETTTSTLSSTFEFDDTTTTASTTTTTESADSLFINKMRNFGSSAWHSFTNAFNWWCGTV